MSGRAAGAAAAVTIVVTAGLLGAWLRSDSRRLHDPAEGLQQLDLLYLDEPAPRYRELGFRRGRPGLLLVCATCQEPAVDAQVRRSTDPDVARAYALLTTDGAVGPGYALLDAAGRVRYRTFDPNPADHAAEIAVLLDAL